MQPDPSSDAAAGGQQAGGKGGLKQGLYLQQQQVRVAGWRQKHTQASWAAVKARQDHHLVYVQKHGPKQQPLAGPAGGALAKAAGGLHAAAYRRSSGKSGAVLRQTRVLEALETQLHASAAAHTHTHTFACLFLQLKTAKALQLAGLCW